MPLTHDNPNVLVANPDNRFHWARLRDDVAEDIPIARRATPR